MGTNASKLRPETPSKPHSRGVRFRRKSDFMQKIEVTGLSSSVIVTRFLSDLCEICSSIMILWC